MGSPSWKGRSVTPATARARTAQCGHSPTVVTTSKTFSWGPSMTTSTSKPGMTLLLCRTTRFSVHGPREDVAPPVLTHSQDLLRDQAPRHGNADGNESHHAMRGPLWR